MSKVSEQNEESKEASADGHHKPKELNLGFLSKKFTSNNKSEPSTLSEASSPQDLEDHDDGASTSTRGSRR